MVASGPLRVLIIDDNEAIRMILSDMLASLGHQVVGEAEDSKSALAAYARLKPDFVTLDISLSAIGGGDGLSVLKEIRRLDPAARIIVVSGNSQKKVYEQLEKDGAAAFIPKPIKEDALIAAVARATRA